MIVIELSSHVGTETMEESLREISRDFGISKHAILIDTLGMQSYDMGAQKVFTQWVNEHSDSISKVAIVSDKQVWHMVISTMSPMMNVPMRVFYLKDDAKKWVKGN